MTLDPLKASQQIHEIRALWREWDPIGVYQDPESECPPDEYDFYLVPCVNLLVQRSSVEDLASYLAEVVGEGMGLGDRSIVYPDALRFAYKLQSWFSSRWVETRSPGAV